MGKKIINSCNRLCKIIWGHNDVLEVAVSNLNAIAFYEKLGFIGDSYRYNYYGTEDKEMHC